MQFQHQPRLFMSMVSSGVFKAGAPALKGAFYEAILGTPIMERLRKVIGAEYSNLLKRVETLYSPANIHRLEKVAEGTAM